MRRFVDRHRNGPEFQDETRLLAPILAGGRILYVVDGSDPYSRDYEAEMEILRWTGRPRMALINRIGPGDHSAEWRKALGQYFSLVREFDANRVGFEDRVRLLESFRELDEGARSMLDEAIAALRGEREGRRREAAREIAALVGFALTNRVELALGKDEGPDSRRAEAWGRLTDGLREREAAARAEVQRLYRRSRLVVKDGAWDAEALKGDLFAERTWQLLGLSHGQTALVGALLGGTVGGLVDVKTGGTSLGMGILLGALSGGGYMLSRSLKKLGSAETLAGQVLKGTRVVRFGPIDHVKLPWVLLDRAVLHHRIVSGRPHSVRGETGPVEGEKDAGVSRSLGVTEARRAEKLFSALRKSRGGVPELPGAELRAWVESLLQKA